MRPEYEVSGILQRNTGYLKQWCQNSWQLRTLNALAMCRTQALGGHVDICSNPGCRKVHISYNSCRNRHCPKCQGEKREEWIRSREAELFNTPYYHVVFTLPMELNLMCIHRPVDMYNLLFKTAWLVIKDFAANTRFLGAKTGMISILHTWGQNLSLHPHLHCIVPGGGLSLNNKWKALGGKGKYLFPVKAMSKVFRARFTQYARKTLPCEKPDFNALFSKPRVVYCKQPFWGPQQVIEYLGRYTHKIAISNHRIKNIDNQAVTFSAKNYRNGGEKYNITLSDQEFIRRFCIHILPKGFTRIRHYGILSSTLKKSCIALLQEEIGKPEIHEKQPVNKGICYVCGKGKLITVICFNSRGPPSKCDLESILNSSLKQLPE